MLSPHKELYIPKVGLKKDLGINIIDVKDVKDVSFWAENVFARAKSRRARITSQSPTLSPSTTLTTSES